MSGIGVNSLKAKRISNKKGRIPIPEDVQAQILFSNDHCCCICHKGPKHGIRVQIHHINGDRSDNQLENLAVLCRDCHDELKDKLWMGKRFFEEEVRKYKALWETAVSEKRRHLAFPPAVVKEKIDEKVGEKGIIERHIEREISYTNGLAPQAFGVSPPVSLSKEKKHVLEEAKQIITSQPSIEKLLPIFNGIKRTAEIRIEDMVLLSRICLSLGDLKFHAGDYSMAEVFYKEALGYGKSANEPEIVGICLYELGASVGMQGRHKEALDFFDECIKMNENDQDAWYNKGVALSFLEEEEAISAYCRAVEFGTKAETWDTVASAYHNMGVAQRKLEKYKESVDSYLKAINLRGFLPDKGERIFPAVTSLIFTLGMASIQNKNYDHAKELAKKLSQVYFDGEKDKMSRLQEKTIEEIGSKISKKEHVNAFQELKKLFDKFKN